MREFSFRRHTIGFACCLLVVVEAGYANQEADRVNRPGPRYQVNHVWTEGEHSDHDGGAILPDVLRWMWQDGSK